LAGDGSVTIWLDGLKAGDERATRELWERYFPRLVGLASKRLPHNARREADEEDVALSAFHSLCDRAARGRFPELANRDELWRLLSVITARKAVSNLRRRSCLKRGGGGVVVGESALLDGPDAEGLAQVLGPGPSPEAAAQAAEVYGRLMEALGDDTLRAIARMRMEGHTAEEIAARLGVCSRTVVRKLCLIRDLWREHESDEA
jgi:DNA-directed RNA polymerase specialized sigma24 family protein